MMKNYLSLDNIRCVETLEMDTNYVLFADHNYLRFRNLQTPGKQEKGKAVAYSLEPQTRTSSVSLRLKIYLFFQDSQNNLWLTVPLVRDQEVASLIKLNIREW